MPSDNFWSVELGKGMGPLVLGTPRTRILQILRDEKLDADLDDGEIQLETFIESIDTVLLYASDANHGLNRIDVSDDRLRFGPMQVHGKRVHEIVQLLGVPPWETLWCDFFEDDEQVEYEKHIDKPTTNESLLLQGTLWITSLGLGLSLYNCEVETVHLCDPEHSPQHGSGKWTKAQEELSIQGIKVSKFVPTSEQKSPLARLILFATVAAFAILVWNAFQLQQQWNQAPEVAAKVVSMKPPPPEPFPDEYTLSYVDKDGGEHQAVFRANDLYGLPAMGDEVTVRYLPEAPDKPLSRVRFDDVGFSFAMPYAIAIFATYLILNFVFSLIPLFWSKRT